jgi:predicted  nucleic acid-binding Zn-ribbon protein
VSVFSDGLKITELIPHLAVEQATSLKKMVPAKSGDVMAEIHDIQCKACRKDIRIQEVVVTGWRDHESVDCPVCGAKDIFSSMCWSLFAHPVKFPFKF